MAKLLRNTRRDWTSALRILTAFTVPLLAVAQTHTGPQGFSPQWIDRSVNPCDNFYRFACGVWIRENPVPADQSRWSRFNALGENNQVYLREILEKATVPSGSRDAIDQRIGDHYASCMDTAAVDAKGAAPLDPYRRRIDKVTPKSLPKTVAALHSIGVDALFRFGSQADYEDSSRHIAGTVQGGIGMPDRDYYLKTDARSEEIRKRYREHVTHIFELLGEPPVRAAARAGEAVTMETALAKVSLDRVSLRNPRNRYKRTALADLERLTPSFSWKDYLRERKTPAFDVLNAPQQDFLKEMERMIGAAPLEQWKSYLTWRLADTAAGLLSKPFVEANFNFYERILRGQRELAPRTKQCTQLVDRELGEALGRRYVEKHFPPESRRRMLVLVAELQKAFERDIRQLEWMTPETRKRALEKLAAVSNKIGYPEKWRDYSQLRIRRGDLLGNSFRAAEFEERRGIDKIGELVDKTEWRMTAPTVNAYYSPLENNINFPAGILQPPLFDPNMDDAVNLGGIGGVIGHELTHGFDDQGRLFDPAGNFRDWWTPEDAREFQKRAECFIGQYSGYKVAGDAPVNGKLTLGENIADAGGVRVAFHALMSMLDGKPRDKIDGFTPEQRFFLGWAQGWCQNITDEGARLRVATDPHAPGEYRVNGVFANLPEFHNAYGCRQGEAMVRANACRVW
jgi:endothelin-converting enzyme/putative endopeptidase